MPRIVGTRVLRGDFTRARLAVSDRRSPPVNCLSAVSDGGAVGFAGPEVRATAAEVLAKASNAIIMINFRMMGLPSPWSEGFNACRPLKVRTTREAQIVTAIVTGRVSIGRYEAGKDAGQGLKIPT